MRYQLQLADADDAKDFLRQALILGREHWVEDGGQESAYAPMADLLWASWHEQKIVALGAWDAANVLRGYQVWTGGRSLFAGDETTLTLNGLFMDRAHRGEGMEFLRWGLDLVRGKVSKVYWQLSVGNRASALAPRLGFEPDTMLWRLK
ncbi:MAG: hypothetical protein R3E87_07370 [Burkholderiaceae bacterium]